METRTILQIVLGLIVVATLGLGGLITYELTREAETIYVDKIVETPKQVFVNPWAEQGDMAVTLVKQITVNPPFDPEAARKAEEEKKKKKRRRKKKDEEEVTEEPLPISDLMANEDFVKKTLKISGEPEGWKATWWGETKFGPTFYLVRYAFRDGDILVGPEWLVNLETKKVVAKNLPAMVAENPMKGTESELYGKSQQVVSAIAAHRFESKMTLAGALLLYFEQRADADEDDTILGWTIDHDRGDLFKAYFQWVENKQTTYAEFEFDYKRRALKPINLQAANMMNVGDAFKKQRVSIMPSSYDPTQNGSKRWTGAARKQCRNPKHRSRCNALATILGQNEIIESLEWLLTAQAATAEGFEECKTNRKCAWLPAPKDKNTFNVKYRYNLKGKEKTVSWDVNTKTGDVSPNDRIGKLAFSVIRAR